MNFLNHTLAYEDLRDCTLITKNGTKIPVAIDYIETTADTFPKFEGHITGTARVSYRSLDDIRNDALDIIFKGTKCTPDDNSVSSKKRMTFREEVAKLHPKRIDSIFQGGVCGCPRDMDTCPYSTGMSHCPSENDCRACWDREIPDELMDND